MTTIADNDFFSRMGGRTYDAAVLKAVPPYTDMIRALTDSIYGISDHPDCRILELGCGTGNVSQVLAELFPHARLTLVDRSEAMLDTCRQKLENRPHVRYVATGFMDLDLPSESVDFVVSSLALHHLRRDEKPELYRRLFGWLTPGGLFRCADQCLSLPEDRLMTGVWTRWAQWSAQVGASRDEIVAWRQHCDESDHYEPLIDHMTWLQKAGFQAVDCYWRTLFWTVFGAEK